MGPSTHVAIVSGAMASTGGHKSVAMAPDGANVLSQRRVEDWGDAPPPRAEVAVDRGQLLRSELGPI